MSELIAAAQPELRAWKQVLHEDFHAVASRRKVWPDIEGIET
jgi:hypothetical protein